MSRSLRLAALALLALTALSAARSVTATAAPPRWQTLPLPPAAPKPAADGVVARAGARIYYASYGAGAPVILLHGGLGNGGHFAHQIRALAKHRRVIAIDSRGQGRSTLGTAKLGYHVMAEDVVAVMDALKLERASLVGWSDGGAIALDVAIHHPDRVDRLFVYGTSFNARGAKPPRKPPSRTFTAYFARCKADARVLGKPRAFARARAALLPVWRKDVIFTEAELRSIRAPTVVADGDHDEIIRLDHIQAMAKLIPNAKLVIFENTSHFALWQAPEDFNAALLDHLVTGAPAGGT